MQSTPHLKYLSLCLLILFISAGSFQWVIVQLHGGQEGWTWVANDLEEKKEGEEEEVRLDDFFAIYGIRVEQKRSEQTFPWVGVNSPVSVALSVPYPPPEG